MSSPGLFFCNRETETMKIFVANCTRQNHEFHYRVDFNDPKAPNVKVSAGAKRMAIPPGRQTVVGGPDLFADTASVIVHQLERFGARDVSDIARLDRVVPFIFSKDKPVSAAQIRAVMGSNRELMVRRGRVMRQKAAMAVNETVQRTVAEQLAQQGLDTTDEAKIEVEFEQLDKPEDQEERSLGEGYRLNREAGGQPDGGRGRRGRRGRSN